MTQSRLPLPLYVLAAILVVWQPMQFAGTAPAVLPTIAARGFPAVVELLWLAAIALLSVVAAWSLISLQPHAVGLSRAAVILSTIRGIQSLFWTYLPTDVAPGAQWVYSGLLAGHVVVWLIYLERSGMGEDTP